MMHSWLRALGACAAGVRAAGILRAGLVAAPLALAGCSGGGDLLDGPHPKDFAIHGIDVSRWQGDIDWHAVKADNVRFAFIKATEGGDHVDPAFQRNWDAAAAAGVLRGAYHFYYFCRPVEEQIAWFKQIVPVDPGALPPVLDMEWNAHSRTCRHRPSPTEVVRDMGIFMAAIERHYGKRPIIYTTVDFYRDNLQTAFHGHPYWVRSVAAPPQKIYGQRPWVFWQYTAKGSVAGIKGEVDRNAFFGGEADWRAFLAGGQWHTAARY